MHFRTLTVAAVVVPFLAACGGTSSAADRGNGAATSTAATSTLASSSPPPSSPAPPPTGPVLEGQTFTLTLPPGGHVQKPVVAWSHGWDMGADWSLDGTAIEEGCGGGCQENTPASRAQEARFLVHDRRTEHEKRMPDVTVAGITMAHTSGHKGTTANEQYGAQYRGRGYRFIFEIDLDSGTRAHAEALIQQILGSIAFKG